MPTPEIQSNIVKKEHPGRLNFSTPIIRTPSERFSNLSEWSYEENYTSDLSGYSGLRLHYVDVGKKTQRRTALCLHGQKTWSYAFRKTIPYLLADSYRVIAPDFFGFGKSDKLITDKA